MGARSIAKGDREVLRDLARRWRDHASNPVMAERKRLWTAVHDLAPVRPMILFETASVSGFVDPDELRCTDPFLRAVERNMRDTVSHADEVGDDIVVEPWFRLAWRIRYPGFGVTVEQKPALMANNEASLGYTFNFPIRTPADVSLLEPRTFGVDREATLHSAALLQEVFGDILPTRIGNYDFFQGDPGDDGFCGNFFFGLTWQIYRFIGNDGLLYWVYDAPGAIRELMDYMRQDRTTLFQFLERESLLVPNADTQMAGPRAYGYVSGLPGPDHAGPVQLKHLWGWAESQETATISPAMFKEFVLPHIAALSSMFGLVYYGCCEPVHDRLDLLMADIPNLRSVSVSGWSDLPRVAEMLGNRYVYSRKPTPALVSGANPPWDLARKDMETTQKVTKNCCLEILFRDLYSVNRERSRIAEWVSMTRSIFGI
jgi:hypothetical protein